MAKEYPVGAKMYLPVWVTAMESDVVVKPDGTEVKTDARFAYTYAYGESRREGYVRYGQPDRLLTAEEVADGLDLIARSTLEEYSEKAERKIRSLEQQLADANELLTDAQAKVKELTEADCMRLQEFKPIIEERDRLKAEVTTRTDNVKNLIDENDRLKGELEQEKKRTQVWKDSAEEHRQRAEELEADVKRYEMDIADNEVKIQRLEKENNSLKADIIELKAQIDVFGNGEDRETLKKKLNAHEKIATTHRKAIIGLGRAVKEKDCIISALVKRVMELEKGGESNG